MEAIRLHVDADAGLDTGRPVLILLHGLNMDSAMWDPVRDDLRHIGQTATVDLLGHGASPAPPEPEAYTFAAYLAYCEEILARLALTSAWWVGFSMGGWIVQRLALERPHLVQGLVLAATHPGMDEKKARAKRREEDLALADGTERNGMDWFFDRFYARFPETMALPEAELAALRALRTQNPAIGIANSLRAMGTGLQEPVWDRLNEISVPALVVCGDKDQRNFAAAPRMAALVPRSRLEIIPEAGHALFRQRPREFAQAMEHFFAALP
jgi:2-succinyl-6-hydroxy-2,4-cyclohexadiene-1-carboxylate synthase